MKCWTHDGAYVAGFILLVVSCVNLFLGVGWEAVGGMALAVALLVALRVVEHYVDVRENLSLKSDVAALKMAVHRLESESKATKDLAETAAAGVREVRTQKARPGY